MSFFNFSGIGSPPRRPLIFPPPTSPFCTSPSQLEEVTLEQDVTFSNSLGLRSPNDGVRGRSIKEFEEQLSSLKKENFNLKLRIYFLEERMGSNFNLDKEDIVKNNVELMVELESLKKELQEKHELLCEAVKAMELEDEEHKKTTIQKDEELGEFRQEIDCLKNQLIEVRQDCDLLSHKSYPSSNEYCPSRGVTSSENSSRGLQERIICIEDELNQEKESNAAIQLILGQKDVRINALTSQLEEANQKISSLEENLRDVAFRMEETKAAYGGVSKTLREKSGMTEEILSENRDLHKKHAALTADLEKERKRCEKIKVSSEQKISELQSRLEISLSELKKSQDLVVSKSPARRAGNTDADSFSVSKPATPSGSPQKDSFDIPAIPSPIVSPTSSPSPSQIFNANPDLRQIIEQLKAERDSQQQKIVKLKAEQIKACKIIKGMMDSRSKSNEEILALKKRNEELEQELEGAVVRLAPESNDLPEVAANISDDEKSMEEPAGEMLERYKSQVNELEETNQVMSRALEEKNTQLEATEKQLEEISKGLKQREDRIVDLEFELLSQSPGKSSRTEENCHSCEAKNEEIEHLNEKLIKRTFNLQDIVNHELWEKNKEIERLHKKRTEQLSESKNEDLLKLQECLSAKDAQLQLLKSKISELGIEIDLNSGDVNENYLQDELKKSEKLRQETNEVCMVLSKRLEELAVYLDSLLKQKSVLGFLGQKENIRLRQIIDQSLDFSRSFTLSMIINPEQSLLQLSNISSLLENTEHHNADNSNCLSIPPSNTSLTYHSHLYNRDSVDVSQIIDALRQQIIDLKYELQLRDVELGKVNIADNMISSEKDEDEHKNPLNTSTTLKYKSDNQSESEAWSEPDRTVSRARMGIKDATLNSNTSKKALSDSTEEDEIVVKNSQKKSALNETRLSLIELHKQVLDLNQKLTEKEEAYYEVTRNNNKLNYDLQNTNVQLENIERKLKEAEAEIEELRRKDREWEDKFDEIAVEKTEILNVAKEAEELAAMANDEMKSAEAKIRALQEEKYRVEESLYNKMKLIEEDASKKIDQIQCRAEMEIQALKEAIQELHGEYAANYMKKCEVEEAVSEIERLKGRIVELEEHIEEISGDGMLAKEKLAEYEEKINYLRADLDNSTLQYSEAVLEKTKIANEKAALEQEVNIAVLREVDLKKQLDVADCELINLKQSLQKQISTLVQQKSRLQMRISELESSNAELHNKLVKIQAGCGDSIFSSPLPNNSNFVNQIVSFRRQHSDNSGYLSEDHNIAEEPNIGRSLNSGLLLPILNVDVERHEANSSPDLGIESDQGRFSSLEAHVNVTRPLLQTLELTASMNNLLDLENNQVQPDDCDSDHCCQKTMEMAHENSDLKRKLLRTRRALEETVTQLSLANQRKKQVEKTICKQIHKTSQVLRKAKANLDSGSETDVYKK